MNKAQKEVLQYSLKKEQESTGELKDAFERAKKDVQKRIAELDSRSDTENVQSVVYQKKYQQAILAQINDSLNTLKAGQYSTVSGYLEGSYRTGYIGTMYSLQQQGIPLTVPINQENVRRSLEVNSKLSKPLYDAMGENVTRLRGNIRSELSRSVLNGSSWEEAARHLASGMNTPFDHAYNRTITIMRTEGHRIQNESIFDAMSEAKDKGADVVKQWCATLDDSTRESHAFLDGEIRELDEEFSLGYCSAQYPGEFGYPAEDINCRCVILERAKWALGVEELETLQDRAKFFNLDKSDSFDDYVVNYLSVYENEVIGHLPGIGEYTSEDLTVDLKYIYSSEYRKKFDNITNNKRVNSEICNRSRAMLRHRTGTDLEDMVLISSIDGSIAGAQYASKTPHQVDYNQSLRDAVKAHVSSGDLISIHNHGLSQPPSGDDLSSQIKRNYKFGVIPCHDGRVIVYQCDKSYGDIGMIYSKNVDKYYSLGYNINDSNNRALELMKNYYGLKYEVY